MDTPEAIDESVRGTGNKLKVEKSPDKSKVCLIVVTTNQ